MTSQEANAKLLDVLARGSAAIGEEIELIALYGRGQVADVSPSRGTVDIWFPGEWAPRTFLAMQAADPCAAERALARAAGKCGAQHPTIRHSVCCLDREHAAGHWDRARGILWGEAAPAARRCTCGTQAVGGKCSDWCDLVRT